MLTKGGFGDTDAVDVSVKDLLAAELLRQDIESGDSTPEMLGTQLEYGLRIPLSKGGTLDLDNFPYQREPFYSDEIAAEEECVIMKATQVGASEAHWRWILRRVDQYGETGIYYFPDDTHVTDFADERIGPVIDASEYLQRRLSGVNQKHLKQFGAGTLYIRGVKSLTAVQSVAADAIVFDEYDECDPKNLAHAERRLSGARAAGRTPRVRRMGRPSLPGYGIAAAYEGSDQRVWMVTCPECGLEQELTFADNVRWLSEAGGDEIQRPGDDTYEQARDVTDCWRCCKKCGTELESEPGEPGPIHAGRWKPTAKGPGRIPGYHVTRLIVPRTDLKAIIIGSRSTRIGEVEVFHWADLGLPYAAADSSLDDLIIDRACAAGNHPQEQYSSRFPVVAGIDVASERALNICVAEVGPDGRRRDLLEAEVQDDPGRRGKSAQDKLAEIIERYRVQMTVIDSEPERRMARALANRFPGRVFLCSYTDQAKDAIRVDIERRMVTVDRTEAMDAMMDGLRELSYLPLRVSPPRFREQLKSPKRRVVEDDKGRQRRVYVKTGSMGDDYAHACVYQLVAHELVRMLGAAKVMKDQGEQEIDPAELGVAPSSMFDYNPGFGEG